MLGGKNRLNESKDYKRVEENGKVFQSQNFGISILERGEEGPSRFGFIVSTKIAKDAVDRNLMKRVMSEAVRTSMVDVRQGLDVVFLAKTTIVRTPTSEIMKEVKLALKESGIIK